MKRVRRQKNKSARIKFKQKRNAIIIVIIALCLIAIYGFNLWTKSEVLKTTAVKFVEYETGREIVQEIEVHMEEYDDETKYYIYLPEDVNGYDIIKFVNTKQDSNVELEENIVDQEDSLNYDNQSDSLFDSILNTDAQNNIDVNTTRENVNTNTIIENTVIENTNTIKENAISETENTNTTTENTVTESKNTNTTTENTVTESKNTNTTTENTVTESKNTNTTTENTVNENTNTNTTIENTIIENINTVDDNKNEVNNIIDNVDFSSGETLPGEKIYLSEKDVMEDTIVVNVEFDTKIFDNTRLYNRNLKYEDEETSVVVSGYIPYEYYISVKAENIEEMEELKADVDELKESIVLAAYDIKILNEQNQEYQPINYNQILNVSVESKEKFDGRLIGRDVNVVHVDESEDEIIFEKIEITDKTIDTISCNAVKFSKYLVLVEPVVASDKITINDYESDYNYYMGKNFTDDFNSDNDNTYNDTNLARVTINYYSAAPADRGTNNEAHIGIVQDNPASNAVEEPERQTLMIYNKAVPIVNQKISLELIDNPFNDRPVGKGFNGWTFSSNENVGSYNLNISTHSRTYVQTLTATIGTAKEIVINLYPNWVDASVVFFNPSASSNGNGLSEQSPVNSWTNVQNWFNSNGRIKNIDYASDREVNIVVLCGGQSRSFGANILSHAFTLTGLYNGKDYRNANVGIYFQALRRNEDEDLETDGQRTPENTELNNDYQISYINILNCDDYKASTAGTNDIGDFFMTGNSYNLRFGRGMTPLTIDRQGNSATLGQIRGATLDGHDRSYKVVIETGRYCNIQAGHSSGGSAITGTPTLIIGSDFDRAKKDDSKLKVYSRIASRTGNTSMTPASDMNGLLYDMRIRSGEIGVEYFKSQLSTILNGTDSNGIYAGIYVGGHGSTGDTDYGTRQLLVEGGTIANIIGGLKSSTAYVTNIYMKGGNVYNIVAGAGRTETRGDRRIQITDGKVYYSVSGGSNGFKSSSGNDNGALNGKNIIYIGGNAVIGAVTELEGNNNPLTSYTLYGVEAGCVLGAGNGNSSVIETGRSSK